MGSIPIICIEPCSNDEEEHRRDVLFFIKQKEIKMEKETKNTHSPVINGFIDVKKHFATSNCPIYDVVLYTNLKEYPLKGQLYSKIKYNDVRKLLEQGIFKPTPLSEALFYKKFQKE